MVKSKERLVKIMSLSVSCALLTGSLMAEIFKSMSILLGGTMLPRVMLGSYGMLVMMTNLELFSIQKEVVEAFAWGRGSKQLFLCRIDCDIHLLNAE